LLIPARVDVPQDRIPFVNWLIIAGAVAVFVWQTLSIMEHKAQLPAKIKEYENKSVEETAKDFGVREAQLKKIEKAVEKTSDIIEDVGTLKHYKPEQYKETLIKQIILEQYYVWEKIRPFILDGLTLKGLFGHMWLHGDIFHILGNMLFLWIFGNAICAKIGNLRYIPVYIGLGLIAGISHLIFAGGSVLGASGAINGLVGMFLVLFPQNEITCYLLLGTFIRQFSISSAWMILFWLAFDIWGAMGGGGGVAYFAHLGGFAGGVVLALLMLKYKMLTMERYERSILQVIEEYRHPTPIQAGHSTQYYDYLSSTAKEQPELPLVPIPPVPFEPKTILFDPTEQPQTKPVEPQIPKDEFIRFTCSCGKRLKMPAKYAGKTGKCPQCSGRLKIPNK
jgi:membrane associated rhomboid family serine protease